MNDIIKQISNQLADRSSRRGFFSTIGIAAAGAAAFITGHGFFAQAAEATTLPLYCCTLGHSGAVVCSTTSCPPGTTVKYTWHCGHNHDLDQGDYYICHDCLTAAGKHVCVYATSHT